MANIAASKSESRTPSPSNKLMAAPEHSYASVTEGEDEMETLRDSELEYLSPRESELEYQSPVRKKLKNRKREMEPSLSQVQDNILKAINSRADSLEKMIRENSSAINELRKSVKLAADDITKLKEENKNLCDKSTALVATVKSLEERLSESERYRRRWALRLHGVKEVKGEEVKRMMIDICHAVAPGIPYMDMAVDVAHRLGQFQGEKTRPIIVLFAFRTARDAVWLNAKNNAMLRERKLKFTEDLTQMDKAARNKLWPLIEAARKAGKKAGFKGVRGFIEGKEVFAPG